MNLRWERGRTIAHGLVANSRAMNELAGPLHFASGSDANLLVLGETGTGKEVTARAVHAASARGRGPFVALNCGALPRGTVEAELFGVRKGAFTGALSDRLGLFRAADRGTILLDEIAELPLDLQSKLLRVVQERTVRPVGGEREYEIDVRVIAATNEDLGERVKAGEFREDLLFRLDVLSLHLPPLRARREDIPGLCAVLLTPLAARHGRNYRFTAAALERLGRHDWPGNVRQLSNIVERVVAYADADWLDEDLVAIALGGSTAERSSGAEGQAPTTGKVLRLPPPVPPVRARTKPASLTRTQVKEAIDLTEGNVRLMARLLQISPVSVYAVVDRTGLQDDPTFLRRRRGHA
jgi:two-component system, NtrC family, response regulator GlrR